MNRQKYIKKIEDYSKKSKLGHLKKHLTEYQLNVHIESIEDFYNKYDEDGLETRDLNLDLEGHLLGQVEKLDFLPNLKINLVCPKNFELDDDLIVKACVNHFKELSILQFHKNRKMWNKWARRMIGGVFFLGLCLLISNFLHYPMFDSKPFCKVLSEGFSIIGWVAIWEPATYLLYQRKENSRDLRNRLILHTAEYVVIRK